MWWIIHSYTTVEAQFDSFSRSLSHLTSRVKQIAKITNEQVHRRHQPRKAHIHQERAGETQSNETSWTGDYWRPRSRENNISLEPPNPRRAFINHYSFAKELDRLICRQIRTCKQIAKIAAKENYIHMFGPEYVRLFWRSAVSSWPWSRINCRRSTQRKE